jgi:CheY-like chemotaxis protein
MIVDLTLEGMSGEEFIGKVLQLRPDVPVLATSGYPQALRKLQELPRTHVGTLEKPFTLRMLTDALDRLLARQKSAPS